MNKLSDSIIKNVIKNEIKKSNSIFVFPTQICASMWIDEALEFTEFECIASNRFIAWDDFKSESIKSQQQKKDSIPAILRSIFAENIILQNSKNPFFKNIITQEYATNAFRFANWIASILPSLAMWKKCFEKKNSICDEEDLDFLELYNRYKKFLDENNLFDPAWETPPFSSNGKKYIIFFPEILMDYSEYQDLLEASSDIQIVHIPQELKAQLPQGHSYLNSRFELKDAIHYLWKIHNEKNIPWNKMAISVLNIDSYGPYLERELSLYEIPYVQKKGKPLSSSGIGSFFIQILNCYSENFSFDSIKNLLLNKELPWKEPSANDMLIQFGRENNCICSYKYDGEQIDVWKKSFKNPVDLTLVERVQPLYENLKKIISKIVESKSFSEIRVGYFEFREKFFDFKSENFPKENDKLLSRCISELGALINLEEKFGQCKIFEIPSYYNFFCNYLKDKLYVPQVETSGVQILPYKTASCAPFQIHLILDSSQNGISVVYKPLSFLRDEKRRLLGFANEQNVTQDFILLYAMNCQTECLFTCAQKTFDGYAFLNSYLLELSHIPQEKNKTHCDDFAKLDSYTLERESYFDFNSEKFPSQIYKLQKDGFDNWNEKQATKKNIPQNATELLKTVVENVTSRDEKIKVTVSDLKKFFQCPRAYMFDKILDVKQADNVATLVDAFAMGNLNHEILELYFSKLKNAAIPLAIDCEANSLPKIHYDFLIGSIEEAISISGKSYLSNQLFLSTKNAIKDSIVKSVLNFSHFFNGFTVFEVEKRFTLEDESKEFMFDSRIDCILASPLGELVLIDIKTSKSSVPGNCYFNSENNLIPDFQLPIYCHILENQKNKLSICACGFYFLKDCALKLLYSRIEISKKKIEEENNAAFDETKKVCIENARKFAQYIRKQNFSLEILDFDNSDCVSCIYKSVCRKTFTVSQSVE